MYRVIVGKPDGKKPIGKPRRRWRVMLRWISRKWDGEEACTGLICLRTERGKRSNEPSGSMTWEIS